MNRSSRAAGMILRTQMSSDLPNFTGIGSWKTDYEGSGVSPQGFVLT